MRSAILGVALLAGCRLEEPEPVAPAPVDTLVFKMLTREQTHEDCVAGAEGCTYARLDYPVIVDFPDEFAVENITEMIMSSVRSPLVQDTEPFSTPESLLTSFIEEYRLFQESNPQTTLSYFLERKIFVENNTDAVLCLSFSERSFAGGAHGLATLSFRNIDPRTGADVPLSRVLNAGYEAKLLSLAEARFREVRAIDDATSLRDAGFTLFENGEFTLTDNVGIGATGLTFYYNAMDVAPYALGPTEVFVGYDELGSLVRNTKGVR